MERLTYKNYIEEYEVNFEKNSEKQWSIAESDTHIKVTGEPIDKLAEFEDFMEELGYESLEELKTALTTSEIWEENQALKNRWNKLKDIISQKQNIKNKSNAGLITLFGCVGVESFCKMLLDKMQELEKE